jgi:hypothetical protein
LLRPDQLRISINITTIIMMRRRKVYLQPQMRDTPQRVAPPKQLAMTTITIVTKITTTEIIRRVRNPLMMAPKKDPAATEEVVVVDIEETTTTESTIRMRRASKLLSKMKLIIITTIQRDRIAGDSEAEEAAREVAKVEMATLIEVVVAAREARVAPGLPESTKMLVKSERPTPSIPLAKKPDLVAMSMLNY